MKKKFEGLGIILIIISFVLCFIKTPQEQLKEIEKLREQQK
jgi:hypothetical protein